MALKMGLQKKLLQLLVLTGLLTGLGFYSLQADATELPAGVVEYLQKTYPGVNIRFDALIELPDGTVYLPVLPVSYPEAQSETRVTMTIPENADKPDLVIFSNNLSLLKVIKNEEGNSTLLSGPDVPLKVKLGLLPQDLIVPEELSIPEDLHSILGDLVISTDAGVDLAGVDTGEQITPFKTNTNVENNTTLPETTEKPPEDPVQIDISQKPDKVNSSAKLPALSSDSSFGLSNKILYVTGIGGNQIYIVDPHAAKAITALKVGALPYKSVLSKDGKHLYVVCLAANSLASINTKTNKIENIIKVGLKPVDVAISPDGTKLFVVNSGSGTVSVVNTELFEIINNLEVQGLPEGIRASSDNRSFYLFNRASGIVSKWDSLDPQKREFLFVIKNPYAMAINSDETKLFVTSRTENSLMIYNIPEKKYHNIVKVGTKPVDIAVSVDDKYVYTLDAGEDKISVINSETYEIEDTIDLRSGGFPSGLTVIPGTYKVLVTNAESDKLMVVDLQSKQVLTNIPIGVTSKSLTIVPAGVDESEKVSENAK